MPPHVAVPSRKGAKRARPRAAVVQGNVTHQRQAPAGSVASVLVAVPSRAHTPRRPAARGVVSPSQQAMVPHGTVMDEVTCLDCKVQWWMR